MMGKRSRHPVGQTNLAEQTFTGCSKERISQLTTGKLGEAETCLESKSSTSGRERKSVKMLGGKRERDGIPKVRSSDK